MKSASVKQREAKNFGGTTVGIGATLGLAGWALAISGLTSEPNVCYTTARKATVEYVSTAFNRSNVLTAEEDVEVCSKMPNLWARTYDPDDFYSPPANAESSAIFALLSCIFGFIASLASFAVIKSLAEERKAAMIAFGAAFGYLVMMVLMGMYFVYWLTGTYTAGSMYAPAVYLQRYVVLQVEIVTYNDVTLTDVLFAVGTAVYLTAALSTVCGAASLMSAARMKHAEIVDRASHGQVALP